MDRGAFAALLTLPNLSVCDRPRLSSAADSCTDEARQVGAPRARSDTRSGSNNSPDRRPVWAGATPVRADRNARTAEHANASKELPRRSLDAIAETIERLLRGTDRLHRQMHPDKADTHELRT